MAVIDLLELTAIADVTVADPLRGYGFGAHSPTGAKRPVPGSKFGSQQSATAAGAIQAGAKQSSAAFEGTVTSPLNLYFEIGFLFGQIPQSAVEMPEQPSGTYNVDVQFGHFDFGASGGSESLGSISAGSDSHYVSGAASG